MVLKRVRRANSLEFKASNLEKECVEEGVCNWEEWAEGAENFVYGMEELIRSERHPVKKLFERKYTKCADDNDEQYLEQNGVSLRRSCLKAINGIILNGIICIRQEQLHVIKYTVNTSVKA